MVEIDGCLEEKRSAYPYRVVAQSEAGTAREGLFSELAREAEKQAAVWEGRARGWWRRCRGLPT